MSFCCRACNFGVAPAPCEFIESTFWRRRHGCACCRNVVGSVFWRRMSASYFGARYFWRRDLASAFGAGYFWRRKFSVGVWLWIFLVAVFSVSDFVNTTTKFGRQLLAARFWCQILASGIFGGGSLASILASDIFGIGFWRRLLAAMYFWRQVLGSILASHFGVNVFLASYWGAHR